MLCPLCNAEMVVSEGSDERKFSSCSNPLCRHSYNNQSRNFTNSSSPAFSGRHRRHFKLSAEDYVVIHQQFEVETIGHLARKWGLGRKQIKRILSLNLSTYAEEHYL